MTAGSLEDMRLLLRAMEAHQTGRLADAETLYRELLDRNPRHFDALHFSGVLAAQRGDFNEASDLIGRSIAIDATQAEALVNYARVLIATQRHAEALDIVDKAVAIGPVSAGAMLARGNALSGLGRNDEAISAFERALQIDPSMVEARMNLGGLLHRLGRQQEAIAAFERLLQLEPDNLPGRFDLCMTQLPMLYRNEAEIAGSRAAYAKQLSELCSFYDPAKLPAPDQAIGSALPFLLPYQGRNDRDLQATYGELVCRIMADSFPPASLPPPPADGEPIRLGIVSRFFEGHSNWKFPIKGWLTALDRSRFRIFGYGTAKRHESDEAASLCERFVRGPMSVASWRAAILADAPHVLIYPEVGMDTTTALLAAQRLAPVQCGGMGHPVTTGFPTIDHYLSSSLMEPEGADDHYTEHLVGLPGLSAYCEPVDPLPPVMTRADIGLRAGAAVFFCGQSLFKYLPQHDHVFADIARAAGDCQFVFIEYQLGAHVTAIFKERLERAFASQGLRAEDHCAFLPRLDPRRFMSAIGLCDVMLDSIGWSGLNSTLEALAYDLPLVTWPGVFMRGRHGLAILQMMGITELIANSADAYVALAARLAGDAAWRNGIKQRIAANKHKLYRDRACIDALEQFLDGAARRL